MQLLKIKLAGFKSFVDPTTLDLPSKLIAIVGPNGCGKSNIIDAVSWVMGESSPKYLRGETSTDVIFNGSSSRKPVGQASVELIFDNSDGTIGGEYSKYSEISIKRVISRDSDSVYYLNGARCRKKDAIDIFRGTGLGPRSYSIVGQNMITRVAEAKPDELRVYLEEAAGISKYKDRRHETELRIQHTKENLNRVNDLRAELDKQLSHLKHQANIAEKYKNLKQQERVLRAETYAIEWRRLDSLMVDHTLKIQHEETALEARNSELSGTDREMEQLRHEQRVAQDAFQEVQRRYYAIGNEITRIEQDILHHQERQQQWQNDLKQTENDWQAVKDELMNAEEDLAGFDHDLHDLEPKLSQANNELQALQMELTVAEEAMQNWQSNWDQFNQVAAGTGQTSQVEKNRIQFLEQRITSLQRRQEALLQNQGRFNFNELEKEIEHLSKHSFEVVETLELKNKQLNAVRQEISTLQAAQKDSNNHLNGIRNEIQGLHGKQSSFEALQQVALGQRNNKTMPWLAKHGLDKKPRLAQHIEVTEDWGMVVEKVLSHCLQAICVDDTQELIPHLQDFQSANLCLYNAKPNSALAKENKKAVLLLTKVHSSLPLDSLLADIYVADSLENALEICKTLNTHESVITKDGIWLSPAWIKVLRENDPASGVFEREQELKQLALRIENLKKTETELETNIAQRNKQMAALDEQRDELQSFCNRAEADATQAKMQFKLKQERLVEIKAEAERVLKERNECEDQLKQAQSELVSARGLWQQAMNDLEQQAKVKEELIKERDKARAAWQKSKENTNQKVAEIHSFEIRLQTTKSQKGALSQTITRLQNQLSALNERKVTLQSELDSMAPLDNLNKALSRSLDKHVSVESELNSARIAMESLEQEFHNLENKRQVIEREINKIRTLLESLRVECQGWKVKIDTIHEQMKETAFELEDVLKNLPEDPTVEEWQRKLEQVTNRINRLGPINLVAIDEYTTCLSRKQYLDKQFEDLQSGLSILDDAIAKIDRETRTRFKETFDQVNTRFQELFPTVFGGGKAYIELTNDDLLSTGVSLMACPPGKRNSTIYLLSGGEKSLTAIAFIFSIFYLNPAPFCLLDEVDAALDDANVVRFTRLVKAIANKTQFLFISHNKITIEMGEQLIGVTMSEPGVSRLVSVDIEKAIDLASA